MPFLHDDVLDRPLVYITGSVTDLYITSTEASTFEEATGTYILGEKSAPAYAGPANGDASGRKITINQITDGAVNLSGTAAYVALTDRANTKLLFADALDSGQIVSGPGNTFTLTAFDIEIPDAA